MPDIQDAMTDVKPPIWIQGLHEFTSASAATGYALASEETAVCLIDRIVGTTNALGAFYVAYQSYAPVVVFASQNLPGMASGHLPDGKPRGGIHYNTWQSILTIPWTKWRCELDRLDLLPQSIMKAFAISKAEPSGPTYVTLRQDLMSSPVNSPHSQIKQTDLLSSSLAADELSIEAAAKLLTDAESPILLATNMGRSTQAVRNLIELAETLQCGVLDGRAFLNFPMNHPLFLGFNRRYDEPSPHLMEADVLSCVETYYEYPHVPPKDCEIIAIGPDPAMLQGSSGGDYGGNYYQAMRLVGSSAVILAQLTKAVRRRITQQKRTFENRGLHIRSMHEKIISTWKKEAKSHFNDNPISAYRIAFELNRLWDENTIWVNQTITMSAPLLKGIFISEPGTYFTNPSGHLGPVASMAYGVALARPTEKVIAMMGDGDLIFGNPASVLWTCSHYHIPVLYLVFNNACWGVEWPFITDTTLKLALSHQNYEFVDLDEPRIDFARLAEAYRVRSETLSHPDDAEKKLKWGINIITNGEPALIDIQLEKYTKGKSSYTYSFKRPSKKTQTATITS
jgi:thiamine pyrophosphate-dependent acetolactate synthase large subunit-like protein